MMTWRRCERPNLRETVPTPTNLDARSMSTAVIERENVYESRSLIRNLINAGMTLTLAVEALLPLAGSY